MFNKFLDYNQHLPLIYLLFIAKYHYCANLRNLFEMINQNKLSFMKNRRIELSIIQ